MRMTEADRLRRTEERLMQEEKIANEALERLAGIKDYRVISIRNSYVFLHDKITQYLFSVRGDMGQEAAR